MLKINKNADSRLLTPWLFFILILIWFIITIGVFVFFSSNADIRFNEAKAMSDKLVYAMIDGGYFEKGVLDSNYDILNQAEINQKLLDNGGNFYFNISIYNKDKIEKSFVKGNGDFEIQCRLNGNKLAKCYEREFYAYDKASSGIFKIKILTGSNNRES